MFEAGVRVSAPGSLMLLGEYAVLEGSPALVTAIDQRMHVTLRPRGDNRIVIESALGKYITDLSALRISAPFEFLLTALALYQPQMKTGCDIRIESEMSHTVGFGSSAAITVSALVAISAWLGCRPADRALLEQAVRVIRQVQGRGSGADAAASVYGGAVAYAPDVASTLSAGFFVKKIPQVLPLTVVYSGKKVRTADAIREVKNRFSGKETALQEIMRGIAVCAEEGIHAVQAQDVARLGTMMDIQHGLMQMLGVSDAVLDSIVEVLRQQPEVMGAKISGAGLGDCVVGIGSADVTRYFSGQAGVCQMQAAGEVRGVTCEPC